MATGRTVDKWLRVYFAGYDISGYTRRIDGAQGVTYDEANLTCLSDQVKGYLPNLAQVDFGTVNGVFDNTATSGLHVIANSEGVARATLAAYGQLAEPAQGDVCFGGVFACAGYQAASDGGAMTATIPFSGWAADAAVRFAARPFGSVLHANSAVAAANTAIGIDDNGGASALGGYMVYHVLASSNAAHTATIKVQDAAVNLDGSFADLVGCTTSVITVTAGVSGIVAATVSAVRQYLRWQVVLGTATSVTFVLGFFRG